MSDFHRSLDRALGLAPCRGYEASDERFERFESFDYAIPHYFIAGVGLADVTRFASEAEQITSQMRSWAFAILDRFGSFGGTPLCDQEIPAEGTE